jgi:hypothetical protein
MLILYLHFLFQVHSLPSHTHITLVPLVTLFRRTFCIQKHNQIAVLYNLSNAIATPTLSLPSSFSANPVAAQLLVPINSFQNLLDILSNSLHTWIPCMIFKVTHYLYFIQRLFYIGIYWYKFVCSYKNLISLSCSQRFLLISNSSALQRYWCIIKFIYYLIVCPLIRHLSVAFKFPPFLETIILYLFKLYLNFMFLLCWCAG